MNRRPQDAPLVWIVLIVAGSALLAFSLAMLVTIAAR